MVHRRRVLKLSAGLAVAAALPSTAGAAAADVLNIPLYRQQHALTCEAASLRMALGALGPELTEQEILDRLARDPTLRQTLADGTVVWGDPDIGFVGAFDGVFARDGYGVYDGPIADVAVSLGLGGTSHAQNVKPQDVYAAVGADVPVLVWVPYAMTVRGRGQWLTPDGKPVPYVLTEHCVVVAGLNDSGITYADPFDARFKTSDYATFEAAFAEIENRAVFVSP